MVRSPSVVICGMASTRRSTGTRTTSISSLESSAGRRCSMVSVWVAMRTRPVRTACFVTDTCSSTREMVSLFGSSGICSPLAKWSRRPGEDTTNFAPKRSIHIGAISAGSKICSGDLVCRGHGPRLRVRQDGRPICEPRAEAFGSLRRVGRRRQDNKTPLYSVFHQCAFFGLQKKMPNGSSNCIVYFFPI